MTSMLINRDMTQYLLMFWLKINIEIWVITLELGGNKYSISVIPQIYFWVFAKISRPICELVKYMELWEKVCVEADLLTSSVLLLYGWKQMLALKRRLNVYGRRIV